MFHLIRFFSISGTCINSILKVLQFESLEIWETFTVLGAHFKVLKKCSVLRGISINLHIGVFAIQNLIIISFITDLKSSFQ